MKIFIVGIRGFIGSHLCDALKAHGHYVEGLDNGSQSAVEKSSADICYDMNAHEAKSLPLSGYDYVFHCASPCGPSRIQPDYAVTAIPGMTRTGLNFAQSQGARFIKFSSSEVYGRSDIPLTEDTPCIVSPPWDARTEYQMGFLAAETLCMNHPHPDVQILRLFNVVGPRQRPETGCVIPRFCQQVLRGESLTIFGDGSQRRAFLDVSDLVGFCLTLMEKWPEEKGIWNVSNPGNTVSIIELLNQVVAISGCRLIDNGISPMLLGPHYRDAPEKRDISIEKALSLGWEPKIGLQEIIRKCLSSMLEL